MKVCEITGKVAVIGNNVSHSHHKTKRKFSPNLKNKRFWSEEEGRWITLKVSAVSGISSWQSISDKLMISAYPAVILRTSSSLC